MEGPVGIRPATPHDAEALLVIYRPYVTDTAISFEWDVPSVQDFAHRMAKTLECYPYLVAELSGEPVGYAYAGPFKERAGYAWSVEVSVYVRADMRGRRIGTMLYDALEAALRDQGIVNLYACIATADADDDHLDDGSVRFHEARGYALCGSFPRCARKFGRWYGMVWMSKRLQ